MRSFKYRPPRILRNLCPATYTLAGHKLHKNICLTFDDGPCPDTTRTILSVLEKYNVKALFFCVGDNVRKYPELYGEILAAGHMTGNHTMHHVDGWKLPAADYIDDVNQAGDFIDSKLFRPPHGHLTPKQIALLKKRNLKIIQWDVITYDWSADYSPRQIYDIAVKYTRPGSIVVFHDSVKAAPRTLEILEPFIKTILDCGFKFSLPDIDKL